MCVAPTAALHPARDRSTHTKLATRSGQRGAFRLRPDGLKLLSGAALECSGRELSARKQVDWVLHAHHAEISAAAWNAVVQCVAEQLLRAAGKRGSDRGRNREVVVLLC